MQRPIALLGGLLGLVALAWWLARPPVGKPEPDAPARASVEEPVRALAAVDALEPRESAHADASTLPSSLRGRVVTEDGSPLEGCDAYLSYVEEHLARTKTDADGRFEFAGALRAGTVLAVAETDHVIEPESIELDELPAEELVFVARADDASVAQGLVRGMVVDELDGEPLAFAGLEVDGESLETDSAGNFVTAELHEAGILEFRVQPGGWNFEIAFDPARSAFLMVPARVGQTFYVEIEGSAEALGAYWVQDSPGPAAPALPLSGPQCHLRRAAPSLARLPRPEGTRSFEGELLLVSFGEFLAGRARLEPGTGARSEPLRIALQPYGHLQVQVAAKRRDHEWPEDHDIVLRHALGGTEVGQLYTKFSSGCSFAVFQAGEFILEARLDGVLLAEQRVEVQPGAATFARLEVNVPQEPEPSEPEIELAPIAGSVQTRANRPTRGRIRLVRSSDGAEESLDLEWSKVAGRWQATFAGEVPRGELVASLELEPRYSTTGPSVVQVPNTEELHYVLNDDVPLVDVYLEPVAAEDGSPVLAFEAELVLDNGDTLEGVDFSSSSVPVADGHPSDVAFTWFCIAPGRGAVSGRHDASTKGEDVRIPTRLPRSWGALLYVGGSHYEPLEGVEVFLDGVRHGSTGSHGRLALASQRPKAITLRYRDWTIEGGDIDNDGSFDHSEFWMNAYLEPPRR